MPQSDFEHVIPAFDLDSALAGGKRHGNGHIHETWLCRLEDGRRIILQRVNTLVFPDIDGLMENLRVVTRHLAGHVEDAGPHRREVPALVPTREGRSWHEDPAGGAWRAFHYISGATSRARVRSPAQARGSARAFGEFLRALRDLDPSALCETIPRFHDLGRRFDELRDAIAADPRGRAEAAAKEIEFALSRASYATTLSGLLEGGEIPLRVTHNDCKPSNVLMDAESGEPVAVLDLDTVMPGLVHYDFGDMIRSMTLRAGEDEREHSRVRLDADLYAAVAEGFLGEAGGWLTAAELDQLAFAGRYMCLIIGVRFLADHLAGDVYFRTERPEQNLDRARVQFRMVELQERAETELRAILRRVSSTGPGAPPSRE